MKNMADNIFMILTNRSAFFPISLCRCLPFVLKKTAARNLGGLVCQSLLLRYIRSAQLILDSYAKENR